MNQEEYLEKVKKLELEIEDKKIELMKEFVKANNPYKIGDKVTDHIGSIIIEKIGILYGDSFPCAVYFGLELKKDGTPTKKGLRRQILQKNAI